MEYIAYTSNSDNSINILAGSSDPDIFRKILPISSQYNVYAGEMYTVNGKTWLSADDPAYIESKKAHDKADALAKLDNQFTVDRTTIMEYYTQAVFDGDTKTQEELKAEMEEIKETYAEERKAIEEAD